MAAKPAWNSEKLSGIIGERPHISVNIFPSFKHNIYLFYSRKTNKIRGLPTNSLPTQFTELC
jgi:hypothetical protein